MVTALVTGGSGYFGSLLATRLRSDGHTVRIFDVNEPSGAGDGHRPDFVRGDIRDAAAVRAAVDGVDVVYHNVAQVPLAQDPHLLRTVNVDGTRILLEACADAGIGKVVHTSSSAVFGVPESNPVLATTVPRPVEAYGHAKLAAEWTCLNAAAHGLDVTIVRPRTILGHGRLGIFAILFDWIADGADVFVLGRGDNRYQFVHADDLADACIRSAAVSGPGIFNVGTDRFASMRETLEKVCAHAATGAGVRSLPAGATALAMRAAARAHVAPFAPYHWIMYAQSMWFDTRHVTEALGWTPRWSNDEMFAQSYDWFVDHRRNLDANDLSTSHHRRPARQGVLSLVKAATRLLPRHHEA